MPARKAGVESLSSHLLKTHLSTASSSEDLEDTATAHKDALAAAQEEHRRVREYAIRAYRNNELREAKEKLLKAQGQEAERLRLEAERAELAAEVLELQRKHIPIPVPRAPSPPPPPLAPPLRKAETTQNGTDNKDSSSTPQPALADLHPAQRDLHLAEPSSQKSFPLPGPAATPTQSPPTVATLEKQAHKTAASKETTLAIAANKVKPAVPAPPARLPTQPPAQVPAQPPARPPARPPSESPVAQKYLDIHKRLKQLRAFVIEHAKQDSELKKKVGDMRRQIRKSVGQLTEGKGANSIPMKNILETLRDALNKTASPPIDPSMVMSSPPKIDEDAVNHSDTIPALFIYLLNIFSKALVSQWIDEAGVSPKAADPVGVIAVSIFAKAEFCWRGTSLIDVLLCKMRVVCPVLFGIRGSEKTEEGRARIGWWRGEGGEWVSDQVHNTRMTGLGAGYAAISLRDFSKTANKNPYPPSEYWKAVARIVSTPPEQTSSTQFIVLKAMIENYEQRFMSFYGNAARAALQAALVDFPGQALENTVAVSSLKVLGDKLKRDVGLKLRPYSAKP